MGGKGGEGGCQLTRDRTEQGARGGEGPACAPSCAEAPGGSCPSLSSGAWTSRHYRRLTWLPRHSCRTSGCLSPLQAQTTRVHPAADSPSSPVLMHSEGQGASHTFRVGFAEAA